AGRAPAPGRAGACPPPEPPFRLWGTRILTSCKQPPRGRSSVPLGVMFDVSHSDVRTTRRFLNVILVVAVVDFVLLVPLALGMVGIIDTDSYVHTVGMTHGLLFVLLVALAGLGTLQRRWNWKFPVAVVVAGLVGLVVLPDVFIRRELEAGERAGAAAKG
ncbi:DUF3817 domain-containing protein, partial [Patulibacter sp. S7RM1-6]